MKKLLFFMLGFLALIVIAIQVITVTIDETVTKEDLPQDVYQTTTPFNAAHHALASYFDPTNDQDDYTAFETFMNFMMYDAIKENINADYDPLSDCETDACQYIIVTDYGIIDYAFATLTDEDQMVITVSFKRSSYPSVETAIHLVFDLEVNHTNASFTLTLNHARIADRVISERILDTVMSYVDKEAIEASITYGELDLDNYTYTASLLDLDFQHFFPKSR